MKENHSKYLKIISKQTFEYEEDDTNRKDVDHKDNQSRDAGKLNEEKQGSWGGECPEEGSGQH